MKNEQKIEYIHATDIDSALSHEYRQYLCGKLTREQKYLRHIENDIEVGISYYREFTADKPHVHPVATEHGYVLQGALKMRCLEGDTREHLFTAGDFFVLKKGVAYATKNAAETKILFIKSPGINDKTLVETDAEIAKWLSAWD